MVVDLRYRDVIALVDHRAAIRGQPSIPKPGEVLFVFLPVLSLEPKTPPQSIELGTVSLDGFLDELGVRELGRALV